VILLDEVHFLHDVDGGEFSTARWAREGESPIVFVFAGSEESAAQALREPGQPLEAIGQDFALPGISSEDWYRGLQSRFTEAGIMIAGKEILAIIDASDGHPRRTMLIANQVRANAAERPERDAVAPLVGLAVLEAMKDRSWS